MCLPRCRYLLLFCVMHLLLVRCVVEEEQNFGQLYSTAQKAYLDNEWTNCVKYMKLAIQGYRAHRDIVVKCRRECRKMAPASAEEDKAIFVGDPELEFFERITKDALCLMDCKKRKTAGKLARGDEIEKTVIYNFETKKTYDYLQLCYYQLDEPLNAATAAFTNLVYNPDNSIMKDNLDYYLKYPGVKKEEVTNQEAEPHVALFMRGTEHYRQQEWPAVIKAMEAALGAFLEAEERCRFACEKPFDMGWFPDFVPAVANHFTFCLRCKRRCQAELENLDGEIIEDILPLMYHYLQFAYFNEGKLEDASRAVQSYLLFIPDDDAMLSNRKYYLENMGAEESWFEARPEAVAYSKRETREAKFVDLVEKGFREFDFDSKGRGIGAVEADESVLHADKGDLTPEPVPPPLMKLEL